MKIRKVGGSNVLTVPKKISSEVENKNLEYNAFLGRDGAIVYLPKKKNLFADWDYSKSHNYDSDTTGFIDAGVSDEDLEK